MPNHLKLLFLGAFAMTASCAGAPKPSLNEVSDTLEETLSEWHAFHMDEWKTVDPEDQDDYLERQSPIHTALAATQLIHILSAAVPDDRWYGSVRIDGDLRAGAPATIRLVACPPGRKFVLYSSTDLAQPMARTAEGNDFWVLDRSAQVVEGEGTVDSRGGAQVMINLPDDPFLAGAFRAYQARILNDAGSPSGRTLGFTTAHGRRIK